VSLGGDHIIEQRRPHRYSHRPPSLASQRRTRVSAALTAPTAERAIGYRQFGTCTGTLDMPSLSCGRAPTAQQRERLSRSRVPAHIGHSTETAYDDYRCRCGVCLEINSIKWIRTVRATIEVIRLDFLRSSLESVLPRSPGGLRMTPVHATVPADVALCTIIFQDDYSFFPFLVRRPS
jgi:hypothetical protein